jgi:Putative transposase/Transposase zinc-binding domain
MAVTVQQILNAAFPAYAATHRLPLRVHEAVSVLRRCRTGALGRHAVQCTNGHLVDVRRNSCRHRACPQCGWRTAEQWLERWQARLLPVTHFHVIFTLPHQLHALWRWNRKRVAALFFQATRDALFDLLAQERHLGARPGVLMGLHTWGSALPIHLHLHCLVTAGGVDRDGQWVASRPHFLLWSPILRAVFRAKVLAQLERLLDQGHLDLPPTLTAAGVRTLLAETTHTAWHVRIEPPYADGKGLVVYLARYLRGGPLTNHRLLAFTGTAVCFRYRDRRGRQHPKWRPMTLPVEEFLDRLFQHVPVPGLQMVRAYGLYGRHQGAVLQHCRLQLQPGWQEPPPQPPPAPARCPRCGAALVVVVTRPTLAPPPAPQKSMGPGPPGSGMSN